MVLAHHKDADLRLRIQTLDAQEHIIPFVEEWLPIGPSTTVLEVGCREGGVLLAFLERGAQGVGVEISESRYRLERRPTYIHSLPKIRLSFSGKISNQVSPDQLPYRFDLNRTHSSGRAPPKPSTPFLEGGGLYIYSISILANAIWGASAGMPLQASEFFPYLHLLPRSIYKWILRMAGEDPSLIAELLSLRETGLSIEKLEKVAHQTGYRIVKKQFYLITPIYKYKFGLRPISQIPLIS